MKRPKFARLRARLLEYGLTQGAAAHAIGRSRSYMNARLNGRAPFTFSPKGKLARLLDISEMMWEAYFTEE